MQAAFLAAQNYGVLEPHGQERQINDWLLRLKDGLAELTAEQLEDPMFFGPAVLEALKGCPEWVFNRLDQAPGHYDGFGSDWFRCIRYCRDREPWRHRLHRILRH